MKRRSSRVMVAGLVLLALGAGNWRMGGSKMRQYGDRIAYARELGGPDVEQPFRGTASILEARTTAHELYEDSTAKYEYYHVVYRGGLLLTVLGGTLLGGGLLRKIFVPAR